MERRKAEELLREREERLNEAQRIACTGSWDLDIANNILIWSAEIYRIFEIDPARFRASYQTFLDLVHPGDRSLVDSAYTESVKNRTPYDIVHRLLMADGRIKHIHERCETFYSADGTPVRSLGTAQDITELKILEEKQKSLENQLRQSQKMEAVGQLAGGIAHDFNNFLTAIIGYSNILQMKMKADDPLRTNIDIILSSAEKAAGLTKSLLSFSRKQIINLKPVNLNDLIEKVEGLLTRLIREDIELKTSLSDKALIVMADSGQIEQALMNLATNARDAMPDGGTLTIETRETELDQEFIKAHGYGTPGRYAVITVSDTGAGMDRETRERIFEPFFTTKETGKGTGLGLAMVYGLIKQHNGYINVYSEPGKGTTFHIYLPLIKDEAGTIGKEAVSEAPSVGGTENLLVADDNEEVRSLVKTALEDAGYKVLTATDGEDAVNIFMQNKDNIDLVIFDVIMPKKNGREAYQEINRITPGLKAIFMSGYTADVIHQKGIFDEGLEYVQKPISPNEMLRKVREVLDRKPKSESFPFTHET